MSYSSSRSKYSSSRPRDQPDERSQQPKQSPCRFVVYVGNLMTSDLADQEIEELIKKSAPASLKSSTDSNSTEPSRKCIEILSIKVFHNCLYIEFDDEVCAKAIAQGLNSQLFKSSKIHAYCLDKLERESDLFTRNRRDVNQFLEKNDYSTTRQAAANKASHAAPSVDCELVVLNRQLRKYAESIHEKLRNSLFGLNARVTYVSNGEAFDEDRELINSSSGFVKEKLEDALSRKLLYLIFVNSTNEQFNSMTLYVINHWQAAKSRNTEVVIKENKNMPLNRALDFLRSDYHNYISHLKKSVVAKKADDSCDSDTAENMSDESDDDRKDKKSGKGSSSKIFKFNKKQKKFLKLLLKPITGDGSIKLNDMDRLLTYLSKQKANLINATLAAAAACKTDGPVGIGDSKAAASQSQPPVPLLSMQITPAEATAALSVAYSQQQQQQQHVQQVTQIPSLLSMSYQMPPPMLTNQQAPSLLMQQFHLMPNYGGLGLAGANPGAMSLLGQYPMALAASMSSAPPPQLPPPSAHQINMSTAPPPAPPPSLMSIQANQTNNSSSPSPSTAPSLMSVQPSSLMNLSLPNNYPLNGANNNSSSSSLLGNPPPGVASSYPKPPASNSSNPNNFKQR